MMIGSGGVHNADTACTYTGSESEVPHDADMKRPQAEECYTRPTSVCGHPTCPLARGSR